MKRQLAIITFLLLGFTCVFGQEKLALEHRKKANKIKYIKLDREYCIQTTDTTYCSKIIDFTDTSLSITGWVKTGKDTTILVQTRRDPSHIYFRKRSKMKDTSYTVVRPLYKLDTIKLLFIQIQAVKKDWFKNTGWLRPFGWLAAGAALGVVLLPIAAIDEGKDGVEDWAAFEGMLIGLSAPPLFIGTRKTTYDLTKKWTLKLQR